MNKPTEPNIDEIRREVNAAVNRAVANIVAVFVAILFAIGMLAVAYRFGQLNERRKETDRMLNVMEGPQ